MWRLLIGALALAVACESSEASRSAAVKATVGEGMCKEHGVLEALCTKCNPGLAAVFKAKGDWCEEHGFPESICPICHPERGGRPAQEIASDDGAPADGTKVRFKTKDAAWQREVERSATLIRARLETLLGERVVRYIDVKSV